MFGLRAKLDGIFPSMGLGMSLSMLAVWLDEWGESFFRLVGWVIVDEMRIVD